MTTALTTAIQSLSPGATVSMFCFDATFAGGGLMFFCAAAQSDKGITFGGQYYTPVDVEFSGFETNGNGALPTPHMKLANGNAAVFGAMVNTYGDMVGCTIRRIRTFAQFLDGAAQADPTAYFGPDIFRIERKVNDNPVFIEWELSASIDQAGKMLPGRTVLRDNCLWRYRRWDATSGKFDYTKAQCPYTGNGTAAQDGPFFDINNNSVSDPSLDVPARNLTCCKLRFGDGNPLPYGGFPGAARVQGVN